MPSERLQKILAAAGLASRRKAEELITAGRVTVNGETVTELGTKADPRMDEIRVDGELVGGAERHIYLMVYKPKGHVTTVSDPEGRPTVMDLIPGVKERVFPVGRLDYLSEGLLLMTNDGDLMAKLTHASSHVAKTYLVKVAGHPSEGDLDKLRAGITLPPEPSLTGAHEEEPGRKRRSFAVRTQPARIELAREQENPWYEVTLTEGRNRQIRRMFKEIGFHVEKIKRIRYASLELNLEPGEWRSLTVREINELRKSIDNPVKIYPPRPKPERAETAEEQPVEERPVRPVSREYRPKPAARGKAGFGKRDTRGKSGGRDFRSKPSREQMEKSKLRSDSERYISRTPRPDRDERPRRPRSFEGERPERTERTYDRPRRDDERQRREFSERPPRREGSGEERRSDSAKPSFDRPKFGDRPPRREGGFDRSKSFGDRPPRRESGFDRPKSYGDRPPRREGGFDRPKFGDRPPRRKGGFDRPRRDDSGGERRGFAGKASFDRPKKFGDRPPRREGGPDRPVRASFDGRPEGERPARKNFGPKSFGESKSFGAKKSFDGPRKEFGGPKKFGGSGSKSRGPRSGSDRGGKPFRRG